MAKRVTKQPAPRQRVSTKGKNSDTAVKCRSKAQLVRDIITIAAFIVGLVGIILWVISRDHSELVYAVSPVRTTIVSSEKCSASLRISYNDVDLGCVDITSTQVAIWNKGNQSIRPDNILTPIIIYTDPPVQILDCSLSKEPREEITKFAISDSAESRLRGQIPISWTILENGDGASIQLTYLGSPDVKIYVSGDIEGSGKVSPVDLGMIYRQEKSPTKTLESQKSLQWIWPTLLGMAILSTLIFIIQWWRGRITFSRRKSRSVFYIVSLFFVWIYAIVWYFFLPKFGNWPPFGF